MCPACGNTASTHNKEVRNNARAAIQNTTNTASQQTQGDNNQVTNTIIYFTHK